MCLKDQYTIIYFIYHEFKSLIFYLDSVGGISNGDQQVGPLKKRRMARESMSDCPSPTVSGSGHMNFADDDVIEDEEVEQASRNIASIDSKLAIFEVNKIFYKCLD